MSHDLATLYTIGHSDLELDTFLHHLEIHKVTAIADVRSQPHSKRHPQFQRTGLQAALRQRSLAYVWLGPELGARRDEPECYIHGRADYDRISMTPAFRLGLQRLRDGLQQGHRIALLCAERDPLDCHRTILVCRNMRSENLRIQHILFDGTTETHDSAESRLLGRTKQAAPHLFCSRDELLEDAYRRRGTEIAYTDDELGEAP